MCIFTVLQNSKWDSANLRGL